MSEQESLQFAPAAACLKHSLPGDASRISVAEVAALGAERACDVRR
jgi:2-dehydro-3-deoxygluconokinase